MTRTPPPGYAARARLLRWASLALVAASTVGLMALTPPTTAHAETDDSAVTVKWAGGNDPSLQRFQVDHARLLSDGNGNDAGSGHWNDFKDLEVSVSKTRGLGDEAVTITATGMAGTTFQSNYSAGSASNYLQVFQCWGSDPLAPDFAETCQFGAWSGEAGNVKASDAMYKVVGFGASSRGAFSAHAETLFRSVTGEVNVPSGVNGNLNGLATFFDASTSNELPFVRIGSNKTASTEFEVQSAAAQPYLGCGSERLAGSRCWLVVVPRGTHSGELAPGGELACMGSVNGGKPHGQATLVQLGSPLGSDCSYWHDRIVVPLDFADPRGQCATGSAEVRLVGSELLAGAMSSWQQGLCTTESTVYSLTTNSGDLSRSQLLTNQVGVSVVSNPLTPATIGTVDPALLEGAEIAYAPVANTGLVIAYVASSGSGTQFTDLKLTPRLLAKALTQSFKLEVPWADGSFPDFDGYWPNRPIRFTEDPEFLALNGLPASGNGMLAGPNGAFVVTGPQGDDVVDLLWRYVQSDADAVAFLKGRPDPWGNTINPYYLPSPHPNAQGGGLAFDLASIPIDRFLKADQTLVPASKDEAKKKYNGQQLDSITMQPYSGSLSANASRIFRADTRYTNEWDVHKVNSAGERGAWIPAVPQLENDGRFLFGPTDAAASDRYGLNAMQLALPLSRETTRDDLATARTFVAPTDATMQAAGAAMAANPDTGVAQLDFATLSGDAYPLTTTLYAAVNLSSKRLDAAAREQFAGFLDYSAGPGNVRGAAPGELPDGYVPLTEAQIARTSAVAELLRNPPAAGGSGATTTVQVPAPPASVSTATGAAPTTAMSTSSSPAAGAERTAAFGVPAQAVLGGTLVAGLAGALVSPFLLRRRTGG
ncbi:hypothetical protein [Agromyces badenianii]|uniref:hypothetical protein n=1 Tax=Agromyces badenianii TaxID=2080742 RepID=UPI000D598293|nr:hypothetical protein [Agromyces badenianii]PWC04310.1 hypothetical protein DCE94_09170 [Agromyces badenianii]